MSNRTHAEEWRVLPHATIVAVDRTQERGWHHHAQYDLDALAKRVKEVVEKYENGYDPCQRLQEMMEKANKQPQAKEKTSNRCGSDEV